METPLQQGALSQAQPDRAIPQQDQSRTLHRHPILQTRRELPLDGRTRLNAAVAPQFESTAQRKIRGANRAITPSKTWRSAARRLRQQISAAPIHSTSFWLGSGSRPFRDRTPHITLRSAPIAYRNAAERRQHAQIRHVICSPDERPSAATLPKTSVSKTFQSECCTFGTDEIFSQVIGHFRT